MGFVSSLLANCPALLHPARPIKLPFPSRRCNSINFFHRYERVNSVGRDYQHRISFDDDVPEEPFLLTGIKEAIWTLRSLFVFLVEQPSQLKYIGWPCFQNTLKTATFTLVLLAVLIVALSSTDSFLSYLLGLLQRRTP